MKEFIEQLKAAIMAESYEDGTKEMAYRSVISVKSALDIVDRLAAEQPDPLEDIIEQLEDLQEISGHGLAPVQTCIDIVKGGFK